MALNTVFMGTPEFAARSLEALIKSDNKVLAVFTQPDRPKGRGHKLVPSDVKKTAVDNNIPVYQPLSLRKGEDSEKSLDVLKKLNPDIIIVVAYGQILPKSILELPKYGCINIHGSLLPAYRGAAPIERCVLNGEKETGVTSMYMAEGLDTGDMLIKKSTEIGENETAAELRLRLADIGAEILLETLQGIEAGNLVPEKQDDSKSSYAAKITKEMSHLDFNESAQKIHNIICAITGYTQFEGKRLKIYCSEIADGKEGAEAGTVINNKNFTVQCGDGKAVRFTVIQPEGKKRMSTQDFLRGRKITLGEKLG